MIVEAHVPMKVDAPGKTGSVAKDHRVRWRKYHPPARCRRVNFWRQLVAGNDCCLNLHSVWKLLGRRVNVLLEGRVELEQEIAIPS